MANNNNKKKIVNFRERKELYASDAEIKELLEAGWLLWSKLTDNQKEKFKQRKKAISK